MVDYWFDFENKNLLRIRDRDIYNLRHEAFLRQKILSLDPFTNDACDHALLLMKDIIASHQHVELNSEENRYNLTVLLP